ncbi:hypothetical protein D0809_08835 [Flavobacterium circumlabens]|uniref:Uncharacterized protein n=1 Tax=Flavobacterium circumlabens TaxID=2133765 RepID=A0A4Y7UFL8_9FLAO|nr:hypothetical protein [Flavobacterium circumlabens]TCN60023.1 hypothetical protein EV142_102643 [Flavobacterium circumlabens]TEB45260.1 hypothetical protein D0809_08835 [Flavobacterium circumlabens]
MKNTVKIVAILLFVINFNCKAQQMVQTQDDIYKLVSNEEQFLNKPLKNLLKEIKPEIQSAFGVKVPKGYPCYFMFSFNSSHELKQKMIEGKFTGLYVYVKEPVDEWDNGKRPQEIEFEWTKKDVEKYGNLTVIKIQVIDQTED